MDEEIEATIENITMKLFEKENTHYTKVITFGHLVNGEVCCIQFDNCLFYLNGGMNC